MMIFFLSELNNEFDLVMIAEKFDESLLLLQSQLCWKVADITYLKLNERQGNMNLPGIFSCEI